MSQDRDTNGGKDPNETDEGAFNYWGYSEDMEVEVGLSPEQTRVFQDVYISDNDDSGHEEIDTHLGESNRLQKHKKRQRRSNYTELQSREKRSRSQSPSLYLDSDKDISTYTNSEASRNGLGGSPDNAGDVDWDSFLCEDEMLPPSNWEAEFLKHRANIMDRYSYKGLIQDERQSESEDSENDPWYPFDPGELPGPDSHAEVDEASVVSGLKTENKLCFGMIHNVRVKVLPQAPNLLKRIQTVQASSEALGQQDIYVFKLYCERDSQKFFLKPENGDKSVEPFDNIAVLNRESGGVLSLITSFCTFTAYSLVEPWTLILDGTSITEKETCVFVDVVVYGSQEHSEEIGAILDAKKVYLQEPDYRDASLRYENPHFLDLAAVDPGERMDLDLIKESLLQPNLDVQLQFPDEHAMTEELLKQNVASVFNTLTRAQNLRRVAGDIRVRTPLLPYQEEALDFITQCETGPILEQYRLWKPESTSLYKHVITGCERSEMPIETGGGILADDMGLGKTLTMLSAIIRTADEANAFACGHNQSLNLTAEHALIPSRATLVVVPSPLLLNEWLQEIKLHCSGFSKTTIYHNRGREGDAKVLADSDIVLSTYHTIAAESTDQTSPLSQIHWFRLVLDEAHIIRRTTTKLFRAIKKLSANLRWCLTGTPIQNSLEDLAALINFLRSCPFDNIQMFKKHIISPLLKSSRKGVENLRQLLDSVCLRRTKELLNLPEVVYDPQLLNFSAREMKHYTDTRDRLIKMINQHRLQPQNKGYLGVFQLQLQLRRLCNHGTFQKPSIAVDEFDAEQAIALLKKQKMSICEVCSIDVTGIHGIEEQRSGSFTACGHLLCAKCVPKMKQALQKVDERDGCVKCSLCQETIFGEYLVIEGLSSKPSKNSSRCLSAWQYFDKNGCSTKVSALVTDIEQHKTEGKSIVFSCWTRSLDLIGIFLNSRNIAFVRLDGSHTVGQRKWILENYQKDPAIKILLMTTGTGAVGLNLTVANCVYILEPQWNPMVESQAIARVNRLGQTRNVRVVRYIMRGTVEELELQPQQTQKLEYAKIGWKEDDYDQAE